MEKDSALYQLMVVRMNGTCTAALEASIRARRLKINERQRQLNAFQHLNKSHPVHTKPMKSLGKLFQCLFGGRADRKSVV